MKTAAAVLREEFSVRQRKNSSYSLRAFSNLLEIAPGTLSNILSGNRSLPKRKVGQVIKKLGLPPHKAKILENACWTKPSLAMLARAKLRDENALILDEINFKILSEWEHFAVLSLIETDSFKSDDSWIAQRLSITKPVAQQVLNRLLAAKLILQDSKGRFTKNFEKLVTTEDIVSTALQVSHKDNLKLAESKIESVAPNLRDFSSVTMAIDPEQIDIAKTLIREFRKKLSSKMESGKKKAVYRLSIQLFPLTEES